MKNHSKLAFATIVVTRQNKMDTYILVKISLFLALLSQVFCFTGGQSIDITMNRIVYSDSPDSLVNFQQLKLRKFNRTTQIVTGDFEAFVDLDNTVSVSCSILYIDFWCFYIKSS
jgi:hypothetical protein